MSALNRWQQRGVVSLWQYTERQRHFPGWHLSADAEGVASLLELVAALREAEPASPRTASITPPAASLLAVPNNSDAASWAPSRLRVSRAVDAAHWGLSKSGDPLVLEIGADWLTPLAQGLAGLAAGRGDHAIGDTSNGAARLWFWWQPHSA